jgi:hypothetical protein
MRFRIASVVVIAFALIGTACTESNDDGSDVNDAASTIESYIEGYNNDDFEDVMTHFTDESVIVGHPTDFDAEAADIGSIRRLHKEDLAYGEQYTISNVTVDGDTVTWNSIWGEDGCVKGHSAVIKDDKILSWTWGEFVECSELS